MLANKLKANNNSFLKSNKSKKIYIKIKFRRKDFFS
jgi:hypothetical protein